MEALFIAYCISVQILGGGISSSQPASQLSQTLSHSSQIQVDVHVRGSGVGNEALCLEILGNEMNGEAKSLVKRVSQYICVWQVFEEICVK